MPKKQKKEKPRVSGSSGALSLGTLMTIKNEFVASYSANTPKKAKMLDAFCFCCMAITAIQVLYMLVVGPNYKNMFYAVVFTSFGSAILTGKS